jgi:hypothetical protein
MCRIFNYFLFCTSVNTDFFAICTMESIINLFFRGFEAKLFVILQNILNLNIGDSE